MESVLKTNGVIKKFGNNTILNGINMNINKGDIYMVLLVRMVR